MDSWETSSYCTGWCHQEMSKKFISVSQIFDITVHCEVYSSFERKFNYASSDASIISRAGGRTGLAGHGRTGQAGRGRGRMSVRPCRPWWYHISGHYPCVYAEIETSKLNIGLQSTVSLSIQARSTDYSKMWSKSAIATNSFLVLNPMKKVQDYNWGCQLGMGSFFCTKDRFNN